jgi:hypothetical protein
MPASIPARAALGFIAAALSVLTFHQGMILLLHFTPIPGLQIAAWPYSFNPIAPFGVPQILNLCFWGGLYGLVFGLIHPRLRPPMWLNGLLLGLCAVTVGFFVVPLIKGTPIAGNWVLFNWIRSILINGFFGIGVGIIYPILAGKLFRTA